MIKSSEMRLKWVVVRLAHIMNSITKSRSPTPHRLFSARDWNPSSFARKWRSTAKGLPASAPEPRGRTDIRGMSWRRRSRSVLKEKAWDKRRWDQRMGCPRYATISSIRYSLMCGIRSETKRNLEVGVPRHEVIPLLVSTVNHDPDE